MSEDSHTALRGSERPEDDIPNRSDLILFKLQLILS